MLCSQLYTNEMTTKGLFSVMVCPAGSILERISCNHAEDTPLQQSNRKETCYVKYEIMDVVPRRRPLPTSEDLQMQNPGS